MKKLQPYLRLFLGLIISFPILFQSYHAIDHHILEDDIHCCSIHHNELTAPETNSNALFDSTEDLCPILEYQLVYFLSAKQNLPEQSFVFDHDFKTPILEHPVVDYRDCKNKLRGPPIV